MNLNQDLLRQLRALAGTPGTTTKLTDSTGASQRTGVLVKHELYMVCGDFAFYIKLGNSTVAAASTDQYWPADTPIAIYMGKNTHIAILRATAVPTSVSVTAWEYDPAASASPAVNQYGA